MGKNRVGLQKEISAIFDGTPITRDGGIRRDRQSSAPSRGSYAPPKPLTPSPQAPPPAQLEQPAQPSPEAVQPRVARPKGPKPDIAISSVEKKQWQKTLEQIASRLFAPKPGVSVARQRTMAILIPVLFIVLIFVFSQVFSTPSRKTKKSRTAASASTTSFDKIDWKIPAEYPTTLRDPMQFGSVTAGQSAASELTVKGIVYSQDRPSAVIGSEIVREGDRILDVTVIKINKDSVEFEKGGKKWTQKVQR